MQLPAGVTVLSVNESTRFEPGGSAITVKIVKWMYGKDGPFSLEIPTTDFSPDLVFGKIQSTVDTLKAVRGETA